MQKYVLSFPKSGRTWIRLFLLKYCEHLGIGNPEVKYIHHIRSFTEDTALLILIRDPYDTLVSCYYHLKHRVNVFGGTLSEYINDIGLGDLNNSVKSFAINLGESKRLVVRYEDLFKNIWDEILFFFDIPIDDDMITYIHEMCEFSNVRKNLKLLVDEYVDSWRYLDEDPNDERTYKFRRGVVGGYIDYLSSDDIHLIKNNFIGYDGLYT